MLYNNIIKNLLEKKENEWLEFKSYWYWNENEDTQKGWGELLKDFSALFNTHIDHSEIKYLIFGYDEDTQKTNNFNIDFNGNTLSIFRDLVIFNKKLIDKIKKNFTGISNSGEDASLPGIETFFNIKKVRYRSKDLLIISISKTPYLLRLKKTLQGNSSLKMNNVIIRTLKSDLSPEISIATHTDIKKILNKIKDYSDISYSEDTVNISKVVTAFKIKFVPNGIMKSPKIVHNNVNKIHFELYEINCEITGNYSILYLNKNAIQNKTLSYLKKNALISNDNKIIILTDEFNNYNGRINKNGILKNFNNLFPDCKFENSIHYLEYFALNKLYNELLESEIFHTGNFNIQNFIQPPFKTIEDDYIEDKTADLMLTEWYFRTNHPLMVIKGFGGIGKTTLVKNFLDDLYEENQNVHILFINSHDIINEIMKNPQITDIYDFYMIIAKKYDIQNIFNKELLELSIDNGNLLIVLDGIDEVIAKKDTDFNLELLIKSIFNNYLGNIQKTKIIITCRDYFWSKNELNFNIDTIDLRPFDRALAKLYFEKNFDNPKKIDLAMSQADEFADKFENYIPYVLDMIKDQFISSNSFSDMKTDKLDITISANDYLVAKVCEREIIKLENMDIDYQIDFFISLATKYNGVIHRDQLTLLQKLFDDSEKENITEKIKDHPLLRYDDINNILQFRYDFFNDFFKIISLSSFFKNLDFENITTEIIEIINQNISYDSSFTKQIKKRLSEDIFNDLKDSIYLFINGDFFIKVKDDISNYTKHKLKSSLLIFLLSFNKYKDKNERTELVKYLFENDHIIEGLCVINLHTSTKNKPIFDFSDIKFNNCIFENYDYFSSCKFNENTYFRNSTFVAPLHRKKVNTSLSKKNVDTKSCKCEGIIDLLISNDESTANKEQNTREHVKKIIHFFWINSSFRTKSYNEMKRKFKHNNILVKELMKNRILIFAESVLEDNKTDKQVKIHPQYKELRKIIEENDTCPDFEKIMSCLSKQ